MNNDLDKNSLLDDDDKDQVHEGNINIDVVGKSMKAVDTYKRAMLETYNVSYEVVIRDVWEAMMTLARTNQNIN